MGLVYFGRSGVYRKKRVNWEEAIENEQIELYYVLFVSLQAPIYIHEQGCCQIAVLLLT